MRVAPVGRINSSKLMVRGGRGLVATIVVAVVAASSACSSNNGSRRAGQPQPYGQYPVYQAGAYPDYNSQYPPYPGTADQGSSGPAAPVIEVTVATATATAAFAAPVAVPERETCLSDSGTAADCKAALGKLAIVEQPAGRLEEVYRRACKLKAKLIGCGAFKSTAITDEDKPDMERLIACENGRPESCEDIKPKPAALIAWHQTLKTDLCKKGENALCANYKQCRAPANWTCQTTSDGTNLCGCAKRCEGGSARVTKTDKSWPDGSVRGVFGCGE